MLFPNVTHCCLCNETLVADVYYLNDDGLIVAISEGQSIHTIESKRLRGLDHCTLEIGTLYCPQHRLIFKP